MSPVPADSTTAESDAHVSGPQDDDLRQRMSEVELALEVLVDAEARHEWLRDNDLCRDARRKEVKANLQHISELCRDGEAYRAERQSRAPPSPPPDGVRTKAEAARKVRKPRIRTLVQRAEKATGKPVTAITMPDGTKLDFSKSEFAAPDNPWSLDEFRTKETKQ